MRGRNANRHTQQNASERGVWGERTDVPGLGSIMSVRGTGTVDMELPVVNFGYSFNLPPDSDAEVIMLSLGGDVNDRVALPVLPRDAQYQWPPGTGGMQHPTDAERRIEFNDDEIWLRDGTFVLGTDRAMRITIDGDNVSIQVAGNVSLSTGGDLSVDAGGDIALSSGSLTHNGVNVGNSHRHGGVDPGPSTTGGPQ